MKTDSNTITSHYFSMPEKSNYLDTSINDFHQYHPAFQQYKNPFYFDLGNVAQPIYSFQQKLNTPFGFNIKKPEYEPLLFDMNNMQIYNTYNKAYSELYYTMALKSESILDAHHSQRLTKNVSFDGRYRYMNADGIYQNQITKAHNLFLNTSFVSNNERYHGVAGFLYNKLSFQENGGTTNDSIYEQNFINKNVVPVVLSAASTQIKEDAWRISNSYDFGRKLITKVNDTFSRYQYIPFYKIEHTLAVNNHYRNSKDAAFDSLNYSAVAIYNPDDTFSYKIAIHTISNFFTFKILQNSKLLKDSFIHQRPFLLDVSAEHQLIKVRNISSRLDTFNLNFHALCRNNISLKTKLNYIIAVDYSAIGYNKNNYKTLASVGYNLIRENLISASFVSQKYIANYNLMNFGNEYLSVHNQLPVTNFQQFKLNYKQIKYNFSIEYSYSIWDKYNYFTNGWNAATINNATVSIIGIKKDVRFKNWHFNNLIQLNNQNSTKTIFPKWMYSGQLYYQNFAFRKALFMQIGLQLVSFEKYYAPYFMPVADNFYYQNQTMISQQHQLQFFINAKIKKVRIFIKADNLLQGTDGHGTYATKYYPLADRTIKFGISWRFLD